MAKLRLLPVIVLLALSGATVAAGQSPPAGLKCGDTITADTVLDRDLTGCKNNGLLIGADDITLDLNGHTISGDGKSRVRCPGDQICNVGVANDDHSGVTIRNGTVRGFGVGAGAFGARDNRFVKLTASGNRFFGLLFGGSARILIRDNSASGNPRPDGDGLGVFGSHDVRIVDNSLSRNGQIGMHVQESPRTLIKGNVVAGNGDFGILLDSGRDQLRRNRFARNGVAAIQLGAGSRNVIADNRIRGGGEGIGLEKSRDTVVVRNMIVGVRHDGIRLGMWDPPIASTRTVVRRNLVIGSGRDGYRVAPRDRSALLVSNVARRSGDDGFDIDSRSARLMRNRALGSHDSAFELP